jgi:hypothetical protein
MPIPQEALDFENRSMGVRGEPLLAEAYRILKQEWDAGNRDRDLALHLMFLAWYGQIEPPFSTGFIENDGTQLMDTLTEVHEYFVPQIHDDAEMLYTLGLAAELFWFMYPYDQAIWEERSKDYQKRYRSLSPEGLNPEIFHDRGYYGDYFEGQAKVEDGY